MSFLDLYNANDVKGMNLLFEYHAPPIPLVIPFYPQLERGCCGRGGKLQPLFRSKKGDFLGLTSRQSDFLASRRSFWDFVLSFF